MACISMPTENMESEREEGEIVDDLDDLSDISSEEEFLLRQRLEILENYNNVLERKENKRSSIRSGKSKTKSIIWPEFSALHGKDKASQPQIYRVIKNDRHLKKPKRPKEIEKEESKEIKINKKKYSYSKRPQTLKIVSESSEDSNDEEYKNKRKKLAEAVTLNKKKVDSTSLKDRLARMLHPKQKETNVIVNTILTGSSTTPRHNNNIKSDTHSIILDQNSTHISSSTGPSNKLSIESDTQPIMLIQSNDVAQTKVIDLVNVSTDDDIKIMTDNEESQDNVDGINKVEIHKCNSGETSDEDIESLRQYALKTKSSKQNPVLPDVDNMEINKVESEDEDSDTEELRMICLRSALLKKAIEMKKKQKLQKRMSHNSSVHDDLLEKYDNNGNSTDVENVDMDIGSDADEKEKDNDNPIIEDNTDFNNKQNKENTVINKLSKEDELEEDEDLLRAKLLTSLSKNLPIFVDINTVNNTNLGPTEETIKPKREAVTKVSLPEKKFIIELGGSDSEGEHEATKNLTKMHMKLAEQTEFQQKLDQFLKSTRMQVENSTLPDVVRPQAQTNPPQKFVPKAMNHLPKSEQIEYKNLVKRMAELEKIKKARQLTLNNLSKLGAKDMLKPRNIPPNDIAMSSKKLEEKIATSRKVIAEESAKMLKLKEEATKLSQRYKIVSNELRNITTAITLNKKQQRIVQNGLTKIRLQHQLLLKSSKHSSLPNPPSNKFSNSNSIKKQKENDPLMKEHKNANMLKSVKVSVVNDLNKDLDLSNPKLSIEVDVCNNKKVVKIPKTPTKERVVDFNESQSLLSECIETNKSIEKDGGSVEGGDDEREHKYDVNDYISPLAALGRTEHTRDLRNNPMTDTVDGICVRTSRNMGAAIWKEDPNVFLCPFEVGGSCRDTDCKYLHLQTQ